METDSDEDMGIGIPGDTSPNPGVRRITRQRIPRPPGQGQDDDSSSSADEELLFGPGHVPYSAESAGFDFSTSAPPSGTSSFTFGAATAAPPQQNTGFSFSNASMNQGTQSQQDVPFSFGGPAQQAPSAFTFGAAAATPQQAPSAFNFSSTGPQQNTGFRFPTTPKPGFSFSQGPRTGIEMSLQPPPAPPAPAPPAPPGPGGLNVGNTIMFNNGLGKVENVNNTDPPTYNIRMEEDNRVINAYREELKVPTNDVCNFCNGSGIQRATGANCFQCRGTKIRFEGGRHRKIKSRRRRKNYRKKNSNRRKRKYRRRRSNRRKRKSYRRSYRK